MSLYNAEPIDQLVWPDKTLEISLDSSALNILTDFKENKPLVIEKSTTAVEAEHLMRKAHVRLKIVIDDDGEFLGIVDTEDLNEQELMKQVSSGRAREDMMITEFMRPKDLLKVLDYEELCSSTIEDVIQVLRYSGQQHCLVVDRKRHEIRGVISASDLARCLKLPIDISTESSFVAIFKEIH